METLAFRMTLKPGMRDEYERRHREIWPELADALRRRRHPRLLDLSRRIDRASVRHVQARSVAYDRRVARSFRSCANGGNSMAELMETNADHSPVDDSARSCLSSSLKPVAYTERHEDSNMQVVDPHIHLWDLKTHHYPWLANPQTSFVGDARELKHDYLLGDLLKEAARYRSAEGRARRCESRSGRSRRRDALAARHRRRAKGAACRMASSRARICRRTTPRPCSKRTRHSRIRAASGRSSTCMRIRSTTTWAVTTCVSRMAQEFRVAQAPCDVVRFAALSVADGAMPPRSHASITRRSSS